MTKGSRMLKPDQELYIIRFKYYCKIYLPPKIKKMESIKTMGYILELEARLATAERFIDAICELNDLKMPTEKQKATELTTQREKAKKRYSF